MVALLGPALRGPALLKGSAELGECLSAGGMRNRRKLLNSRRAWVGP